MSEVNKPEDSNSENSKKNINDPKIMFRKALEKKDAVQHTRTRNSSKKRSENISIAEGKVPRIYRRKSG